MNEVKMSPVPMVYISYPQGSENRDLDEVISRLSNDLKLNWIDIKSREDYRHKIDWQSSLREAIASGIFFLACFSNPSGDDKSTIIGEDVHIAVGELPRQIRQKPWFIPVLLSPCEPPPLVIDKRKSWIPFRKRQTLRDLQNIALFEDWESAIGRIVEHIRPMPPRVKAALVQLEAKDDQERMLAAGILGQVPDPRSVFALCRALHDESPEVRRNTAVALSKIGDPRATNDLLRAYSDDTYRMNSRVVSALINIHTKHPDAIKNALQSPCELVRSNAEEFLNLL